MFLHTRVARDRNYVVLSNSDDYFKCRQKMITWKSLSLFRFGFYNILFLSEFILLKTVTINCTGCAFCGMTHAFLSCLRLDFITAYEQNRLILVFGPVACIIMIDYLLSGIITIKILKKKLKKQYTTK